MKHPPDSRTSTPGQLLSCPRGDGGKRTFAAAGHEVVFHDLYAEQFDPVLPEGEIAKGAPLDPGRAPLPRTSRGRRLSRRASELVGPAAGDPQGLDRPRLPPGRRLRVLPQGVVGLLAGKSAVVLTTSNTPRDDELRLFGDPLENLWKACVFGFCGVADFYRRNFESIVMSTPEQRRQWLVEVRPTSASVFRPASRT